MQKLSGKVALVTGASTGIGQATALALGEEGVLVAVSGRRAEKLNDLVSRIEQAGGRGLALPSDVSDEAQANQIVADTIQHFGSIDILVNSAGVNEAGGIDALPTDLWRKVIDINLMGTIYASKAAFTHMKAKGAGDIINISSTAGRRSSWQFASYATSKFGVTGFTEALRQEAGQVGVRVAAIEPGATATNIASSISDANWREMMQAHTHKDGALMVDDVVASILLVLKLPRRANVTRLLLQPTIDVAPMP